MPGPTFNLEFRGMERLQRDLEALSRDIEEQTPGAIYELAEETIGKAKDLTPVDEGNLRASGHVQPPKRGLDQVIIELGFGGPAGTGNQGPTNDEDVGYAVPVHEDLTAHHTVGQAKYLEQPINDLTPRYDEAVARKVRARLRNR